MFRLILFLSFFSSGMNAVSAQDDIVDSVEMILNDENENPELDASNNNLQSEYENQPLPGNKKNDWNSARNGLKYENGKAEKKKDIKKEKRSSSHSNSGFSFWGFSPMVGQILAYSIALLILSILIYYLLVNTLDLKNKNKRIRIESMHHEIDLDEVEFPELQKLINDSRKSGDYRQTIRWYYLLSLKTLTDIKFISWERQKTNYQYLMEMSSKPTFSLFGNVTLIFEKAWYGNSYINESDFIKAESSFQQFLLEIDKK